MAKPANPEARGNYIGEWFGYRLFPKANAAANAFASWNSGLCPYLSRATGESKDCVKPEKSKGVCSISTATSLGRRDWLVCPYRAFDPALMEEAIRRLFKVAKGNEIFVVPATKLSIEREREGVLARLSAGVSGVSAYETDFAG
jgi:hypothetical protein